MGHLFCGFVRSPSMKVIRIPGFGPAIQMSRIKIFTLYVLRISVICSSGVRLCRAINGRRIRGSSRRFFLGPVTHQERISPCLDNSYQPPYPGIGRHCSALVIRPPVPRLYGVFFASLRAVRCCSSTAPLASHPPNVVFLAAYSSLSYGCISAAERAGLEINHFCHRPFPLASSNHKEL